MDELTPVQAKEILLEVLTLNWPRGTFRNDFSTANIERLARFDLEQLDSAHALPELGLDLSTTVEFSKIEIERQNSVKVHVNFIMQDKGLAQAVVELIEAELKAGGVPWSNKDNILHKVSHERDL